MGKKAKKLRKNEDKSPRSQSSTSTLKRKRRETRDLHPCSGSDGSTTSSPVSVRRLLEPYAKPRLIALLAGAAAADPSLLERLRAAADASPSHRRVFVRGLPPHAESPALESAFSRFGPLADCQAVADRASGQCKGYGFVTFASRAAARRAVQEPCGVAVAGRPVSTQYATAGPGPPGGGVGRRVYITNVALDADAEALRAFFARFGELEGGPFGFDAETGRSRGYALFVYRAADGAMKALEEPYRDFEGRTLHCQLASSPAWKSKAAAAAAPPPPPPPSSSAEPDTAAPPAATSALQPIVDAVVASGVGDNIAMYAQNPSLAAEFLGQNPILAAAVLSSALATAGVVPTPSASDAAPQNPAAVVVPRHTASPLLKPLAAAAPRSPVTAAAVAPSPAMVCARPCGGAGLLGPYKPPSSPSATSALGRKGTFA